MNCLFQQHYHYLNKTKNLLFRTMIVLFFITISKQALSQGETDFSPMLNFKNGMGITAPDTSYMVNFRFRVQNRAGVFTNSRDVLNIDEVEARVRRLRLRMDGFLYSTKFSYYIQLSFSRGDQDWDNSFVPNLVRDAMFFYTVNKNLQFSFGQSKLPGNRQRVISSGMLQFADRSIVNTTFNIDRDFGFRAFYENNLADMIYRIQLSISSGEGRNALNSDNGLAYTGRFEFLPFGIFTNNGDYFEGDLAREKTPKLSLASSFSHNEKAIRTGGQIGRFVSTPSNINTFITDMMFKYNGFAVLGEYVQRNSTKIFFNEQVSGLPTYIFNGNGLNLQASYLFKSNYEIATRYAVIQPTKQLEGIDNGFNEITLGVTKYFKDHRIKFQSNLAYLNKHYLIQNNASRWGLIMQFEVGI
jgi:phosphate-selective porin OprO and OprP